MYVLYVQVLCLRPGLRYGVPVDDAEFLTPESVANTRVIHELQGLGVVHSGSIVR